MEKIRPKASSVSDGLIVDIYKLESNDELYTMALSNAADIVMERQGEIREDDLVNITAARMTPGFLDYASRLGIDIDQNPELIGDAVYSATDIDVYDTDGFPNGTLFHAFCDNWDYANNAAEALHGGRKYLKNGYTMRLDGGNGKVGKAIALLGVGLLAATGICYAVQNLGSEKQDDVNNIFIDKITDSDNDGLSDWNELNIHHTDPTNPDTDGDYISDGKEIQLGTNPLKVYTYGNVLDDFNREFVYCPHEVNCNNSAKDNSFLAKIPNVKAKGFTSREGELNFTPNYDVVAPNILDISLRDPLIEYYAKKTEIILPKGKEAGKVIVDGKPIFEKYEVHDFSPSYYLTHGRNEICSGVSLATATLLKKNGKDAHLYEAIRNGVSHAYVEVKIGGKEYAIDFNEVFEKQRFYELNKNMKDIKKIF